MFLGCPSNHRAFGHKAQIADPICTVIFSILVVFTTVNIMKQVGVEVLPVLDLLSLVRCVAVPSWVCRSVCMPVFQCLPVA